ncbi:MAG TPA: glutamate-1-semialdehyde 2,1-aminomutase [Gemmatimonadaceae bacterium]|nr:glutamate-1-semialdehyde 2,1-aminomutase [Gemmatimonadaceae bacterium]
MTHTDTAAPAAGTKSYEKRLLRAIPGGAHTYSRGFDQFPANAPEILERGEGAYVFDPDGRRYLDYGMALRAVILGYSEPRVNQAAWRAIEQGNNLTRPSVVELEAAETLIDLIDSVDMVKFTKNGSTATSAAVKLARAYTGRTLVARCLDHPFFSYDDWFIGSTVMNRGVPDEISSQTKLFRFNDVDSFERLIKEFPGQIACAMLEPATSVAPEPGYLERMRELCSANGIVLVFDEMITGFRWHVKGAQHFYGVQPDLCTFGKAMANGFSVAAVAGKREIMELGSIELEGRERVFLLSTTHGAEMCGLAAFMETVRLIESEGVVDHVWQYGRDLLAGLNALAKRHGVEQSFVAGGVECSPYYLTLDERGAASMPLRTLFAQEMVKGGVLMPWIALSSAHGAAELTATLDAADRALAVYAAAVRDGVDEYLEGEAIRPVFRRFN